MIQINELRIGNLIERNGIIATIEIINNELDEVMDLTGLEFKEVRKEQAIKANELLKTCPKEQAKLARQLRKLGLL